MEVQKIKAVKFGYKNGSYWGQITWDDGDISATTGNTHHDLQVWADLFNVPREYWMDEKNWEGVTY